MWVSLPWIITMLILNSIILICAVLQIVWRNEHRRFLKEHREYMVEREKEFKEYATEEKT